MTTSAQWAWVRPDEQDVNSHVVPVDDIRDHDLTEECWCTPHVEYDSDPVNIHAVVIHVAADEREKYETGLRKPN